MDTNYLLVDKDLVLKITVHPALSMHQKIVKMRLRKTGAGFIQLLDNVFAFCGNRIHACLIKIAFLIEVATKTVLLYWLAI